MNEIGDDWMEWMRSQGVDPSYDNMPTPDYQYLAGWWWCQLNESDDPSGTYDNLGVSHRAELKEFFVMGWEDAKGDKEL